MNKKIGKLLKVQEVAEILRVSERTIFRYIESGKLKALKLSHKVLRIAEKELNSFVKK